LPTTLLFLKLFQARKKAQLDLRESPYVRKSKKLIARLHLLTDIITLEGQEWVVLDRIQVWNESTTTKHGGFSPAKVMNDHIFALKVVVLPLSNTELGGAISIRSIERQVANRLGLTA